MQKATSIRQPLLSNSMHARKYSEGELGGLMTTMCGYDVDFAAVHSMAVIKESDSASQVGEREFGS